MTTAKIELDGNINDFMAYLNLNVAEGRHGPRLLVTALLVLVACRS